MSPFAYRSTWLVRVHLNISKNGQVTGRPLSGGNFSDLFVSSRDCCCICSPWPINKVSVRGTWLEIVPKVIISAPQRQMERHPWTGSCVHKGLLLPDKSSNLLFPTRGSQRTVSHRRGWWDRNGSSGIPSALCTPNTNSSQINSVRLFSKFA